MNKKNLIEAYKGKNVYVTGITGFKGSWLALILHFLGANVYGIGLQPDKENVIFKEADIEGFAKVDIGDILDNSDNSVFLSGLKNSNPDYVFHLAAQPIVSEGYKDPYKTFNTNIMGTVNIHEALGRLRIPANQTDINEGAYFEEDGEKYKKISFINVTTDKVYKAEDRPLRETDILFGFDPYSLSKSCSDMISQCYREALDAKCYISEVRAGNVIGGGDMSANRIIPDIIRTASTGGVLELRNPYSVRPYQHVFDALTSYLLLAVAQRKDPSLQGEYNVGPYLSQTMKTGELAIRIGEYLDKEHFSLRVSSNGESIGVETDYLALDNRKIKGIGWEAFYDTNNKVVESVAKWYNNFIIKDIDMKEYTLNEIKEAFDHEES